MRVAARRMLSERVADSGVHQLDVKQQIVGYGSFGDTAR